jgi:hypothetical protein
VRRPHGRHGCSVPIPSSAARGQNRAGVSEPWNASANLPSAANKAVELIGRTLGMFVDRKEAVKPNDLSHLTDEELERLIVEKSRALGFRLEKP